MCTQALAGQHLPEFDLPNLLPHGRFVSVQGSVFLHTAL